MGALRLLWLLPLLLPAASPAGDVTVQLFEWRWEDVALECERYLGPVGFKAVQISPPQEHRVIEEAGHPWWQRYQPVSYRLESRSGDRAALTEMVARCRKAGVEVYADAVINHMSGLPPGGSDLGSGNPPTLIRQYGKVALYPTDPGRYDRIEHAHIQWCDHDIRDWCNGWEVQTCELLGLDDLNTGSPYVQREIAGYLDDLLGIGIAGLRIDAAKHIWTGELGAILGRLSTPPAFVVQEVIQNPCHTDGSEYLAHGSVTEFRYAWRLAEQFRSGDLAGLRTIDQGLLPSTGALVFVDNHDTQREGSTLSYREGRPYLQAVVFMLAWPYGQPRLMSGYHFPATDPDQGPPATADGTTLPVWRNGRPTGCNASEWVCEHRHPAVRGMVGFRAETGDRPVTHWWDDGGGQIAFGRDGAGFVAINGSTSRLQATLPTGMPDGLYCDITRRSGCTDRSWRVSAGLITLDLPPGDLLAIRLGATSP